MSEITEKIKSKKILILHDYFLYKGGGERLMITLAKSLNADICTAFVAKDAFDPRTEGITTYELYHETKFSNIPGFRYTQVNLAFLLKTRRIIKNYDIIIYSGDCLNALWAAYDKINIAYMHTPPRHLFDSYQDRLATYNILKKLIFVPYAFINKIRFKYLSKKFDRIITNSKTVQERISKYLGLESEVAYPPSDSIEFVWKGQDDYYLSWARLYPAKRVDMIVKAFTKMPDQKLIIASGGPELEKIKKIAQHSPNITILGWVEDQKLLELLGNCIATIYIPIREDFGMSTIESFKAGKPVIGVAEGGLQETITPATGIIMPPDFTVESIVNAVKQLTPKKAIAMREACEARSQLFNTKSFISKVCSVLYSCIDTQIPTSTHSSQM